MIRNILAKYTMNTELLLKFQSNFRVSAAILDWWAGPKQKLFRSFVDNSNTDKVTEAFSQIPIAYDAAVKNRPGVILPPPPDNRSVNRAPCISLVIG
jgi:hypothetical protein